MMNDELTTSSPPSALCLSPSAWLLVLNALALLVAAVWLRGHLLNNIPGVNGDEAWHGVEAWRIAHDTSANWHTPTGNPVNPLFVGPLALLHLWLPPSIALLRSVALVSGLAALVINWLGCRWVFDRKTAAISTVLLAILPINIAYSRFGWDTSQSLVATLPAVYLALAVVRFPEHIARWLAASIFALTVAFWVHPTNLFAGAAIAVALVTHWRRVGKTTIASLSGSPRSSDGSGATGEGGRPNQDAMSCAGNSLRYKLAHGLSLGSIIFLALAVASLATWASMAHWARGPLPGRMAERLSNLGSDLPLVAELYPRLFTGGTTYRYIAGSRSWFEWPLPADVEGWGLDVAVFWLYVFASVCLLWRNNIQPTASDSRLQFRNHTDRVLLAAWALQLAAFVAIAGPQAMVAGYERFAICLIGPTVLMLARGAVLAWQAASPRWRIGLTVATLAGWPLLADFNTHYFRFIERTGGESHLTFRTAAVDPKQASLDYILEQAEATGQKKTNPVWIVCSEWWNLWPIRYLAMADSFIHVVKLSETAVSDDYQHALAEGRVWFVEFCDSEAERQVESQLAGRNVTRQAFSDYGGRPVLRVLHAVRSDAWDIE